MSLKEKPLHLFTEAEKTEIMDFIFMLFRNPGRNWQARIYYKDIYKEYFEFHKITDFYQMAYFTEIPNLAARLTYEGFLSSTEPTPYEFYYVMTPKMLEYKSYSNYLSWKWWRDVWEKIHNYVVLFGVAFAIFSLVISIKSCQNSSVPDGIIKETERTKKRMDSIEHIIKSNYGGGNQHSNSQDTTNVNPIITKKP